jgi:prolyl 4-hydroxylase
MIPQQWKEWLEDGISKGCVHEELVQIMINAGMPENVVRKELSNITGKHHEEKEEAKTYNLPIFNHEGDIIKTSDREITIVERYHSPEIALLANVLSEEECDYLVAQSKDKIERSTVVDSDSGKSTVSNYRTSSGTFFKRGETEIIERIEKRLAEIMKWEVEKSEGLQILNYQVGQEYKPHYDFFDPNFEGSKPYLINGGQRVGTMVLYLNDVEEGGGTGFPDLDIVCQPKKGYAVYFEYITEDGGVNFKTLHSGMPVIKGEKWIATKWTRQEEFKI